MLKFLLRTLLFSMFLLFALYGVKYLVPEFRIIPFYWISIIYFTLLTLGIFYWLQEKLQESNKKFMFAFYMSTMIRMFGSVMVLGIYLVSVRQINIKESVVYIILYFFYTAFEVVNLIPNLRPGNKKEH